MEEHCGYLGPNEDENTKKIWWSSERPVAIGRQQKCDTISGRISCLTPNSWENNIENVEDSCVLSCDTAKTSFVLAAHKKEHSCWKQIDSQLLERSGKSSIQFFQSMLHHRNIFNLIGHYTQWDKKLPSASITPISHIVMAYYWSHWMMQDFPILQSYTVCCKTEEIVPIIWSHKYRVNKLTSRLRHCNSWDIAEREKRNTIWNFWHPKQRDFRYNLSFWKGEEEHVPGILHNKNKVKRK